MNKDNESAAARKTRLEARAQKVEEAISQLSYVTCTTVATLLRSFSVQR